MTDATKEVVLPSGAFAKFRRLTGRDLLAARKIGDTDDTLDMIFVLMTLCVTIDEKPVTYEQLLDMDMRDVIAIQKEIGSYVSGPIR